MAESFKVQFLQAILFFNRVLKLCGVNICPSGSKRNLVLINLWGSVWLISNFQTQLFVFINRVYYVQFLPLSAVSSFNLRETLINSINYLASCIEDVLVHFLLLTSIRGTVDLLFTWLEPIHIKLQSPNSRHVLLRRIRIISLALIVLFVLAVNIFNIVANFLKTIINIYILLDFAKHFLFSLLGYAPPGFISKMD